MLWRPSSVAGRSPWRLGLFFLEGWVSVERNNSVGFWVFWALQVAMGLLHVYICKYVDDGSAVVSMCAGKWDLKSAFW